MRGLSHCEIEHVTNLQARLAGVEIHAIAAALLVHDRGFPVDLRNPDAFGGILVRPPLEHANQFRLTLGLRL